MNNLSNLILKNEEWLAKQILNYAEARGYIQTSPLDPSDTSRGLIAVVMDITELKEAKKRIQTLTHQLIKAQETERQKISYDLHDQLDQELSALKIDCEMLFANQPQLPDEIGQ